MKISFFWFLKIAKTRSKRLNGLWTERKFVTFNGLPIDKPLITVDLSVQINNNNNNKLYLSVRYFAMELIGDTMNMNHMTPNDSIEFPGPLLESIA